MISTNACVELCAAHFVVPTSLFTFAQGMSRTLVAQMYVANILVQKLEEPRRFVSTLFRAQVSVSLRKKRALDKDAGLTQVCLHTMSSILSYNINARHQCSSFHCRAGSVLANAIATFCDGVFADLLARDNHEGCWHERKCAELERCSLNPHAYGMVADAIDPGIVRHYHFDIRQMLHVNVMNYDKFDQKVKNMYSPLPQPFVVDDYLFHFFHFCDQFLDISPSTWIHFVRVLQRVRASSDICVCSHTFVPLVWATLLSVYKMDCDDHASNECFLHVINFCLRPKSGARQIWPAQTDHYVNGALRHILQTNGDASTERVPILSLSHLALMERTFLIIVIKFDVVVIDHMDDCSCYECQPFGQIWYTCMRRPRPYTLTPCCETERFQSAIVAPGNVVVRAKEFSKEYIYFMETLFKKLQPPICKSEEKLPRLQESTPLLTVEPHTLESPETSLSLEQPIAKRPCYEHHYFTNPYQMELVVV